MSKKQAKPKANSKQKKDYTLIFSAIIFILALAQYINTLEHDYAWDDAIVIRDNVYTQDGLGSLKEIWTKSVYIPQRDIYRPIPQTTFALENHFFPNGNPKVGHFLNILFYSFCCFLLFHFFKRLLPQYHLIFAFLASLLFLVHPIHTEVVANIKSRDEIIALSFGLASMIFFMKYLSDNKKIFIIPSILFFIMACLSKLNAITLLAIYPLLYYFNPQAISKKIGNHSFFPKQKYAIKEEGNPTLQIPLIPRIAIAMATLLLLAIVIYLNNELITLAYILVVSAIMLLNFKKLNPWNFAFLISTLLILSFYFKLTYSAESLFILFLIYCFENKHWKIQYFIPIIILLLPYIYQRPISYFSIFIIHLALQRNIGKWFGLFLISHPISLIGILFSPNYLGALVLAFSTIYCSIAHYKSTYKILPILSILLFIGLSSYQLAYNSNNTINIEVISTTDDTILNNPKTKSLELSVINNSLINEPNGTRYPTVSKIQLEYLKKMFYPHPLIHNYGYNVISNITWKKPIAWISIIIYFLLFLFVLKKIKAKDPIAFGIIFFIVTLSVYSNIVILSPDTMAERFLFFPSVGFSLGFIFLWAGITKADLNLKPSANSGNIIFYLGIGLVLGLGFFKTLDRNKDWKDNRTLATNTMPQAPNSALIHANFAGEWMHYYEVISNSTDQQALKDAINAAERSIEIHPKYFNAMMDLGMMYLKSGEIEKARNTFETSIGINPKHPTPNLNLGLIYYSRQEYSKGISALEKIRSQILENPQRTIIDTDGEQQLYLFLSRCYFNNGELDKAKIVLEEVSQKSPTNPHYYELLSNMYANNNDFEKAVFYLEKSNRISPNNSSILEKLATWKSNL